jgi:hypothetical protein
VSHPLPSQLFAAGPGSNDAQVLVASLETKMKKIMAMADKLDKVEPLVEPLVVRPRDARRMLGGCGNERLWALINSGQLKSFLDGRARRISVASIKEYVERHLAAAEGGRDDN